MPLFIALRSLSVATRALCALCVPLLAAGAQAPARTYANPIDIDYKYNWEQQSAGISYRSGADPVIVRHPQGYLLFVTASQGYWYSRDLLRWRFVEPSKWPFRDMIAPAAWTWRDTLWLMGSFTGPQPILFSTRPQTGRLEFYNRWLPPVPYAVVEGSERPNVPLHADSIQPSPWDPSLFRDDDGRWFMYWGSSNLYPIYGIELDPARRLAYKPERPRKIIYLHPDRHGWERFGQDHRDTIRPYIEGAWMTKQGGKYYLQYAAPGTEYNVYATGTYVADAPLGPFTYAPYNPVGYKPGGFVAGAGHGNSFQDAFGNWWNTGTPWLAVNWNFERRIGLWPAGFDADGQMYVDTRFGDFPHRMPAFKWERSGDLFTGWMLLSYRKPVTASSARDSFPASTVTDENPRSYWVARGRDPGEWLTVDLGGPRTVRAVQVNYADYKSNVYPLPPGDSAIWTSFRLATSQDGRTWTTVARVGETPADRRDRANAYVELARPVRARYVRWTHGHVGAANLAVSDLRVFGTADGLAPATPANVTARRDRDERNMFVQWDPVPGAVGYNVRWGVAPTKLYLTYQRWADQPIPLEIRALTVGQKYWVAVESFDERGVSKLSAVVEARP